MAHKPSKRQFKLFEKEVRRWQKELGLRDWEIYVAFEHRESGRASCWWDAESHIANITLNTEQPGPFSDAYIKRFAFHECMELLMSGCTDIMREARPERVYGERVHTVIRALENVLLGDPR